MCVEPGTVVQTLSLSDSEAEDVRQLAVALEPVNASSEADQFVLGAQDLAGLLPRNLRRGLLAFRRHGDPSGGLLVRGLPVGTIPPTPSSADTARGVSLLAARVLSVVIAPVGEQFGFRAELGGLLVQDVIGVRGHEDEQSSISSDVLLLIHSETAFTELRPDYVALLCLRADPQGGGATLLSPGRAALALLDPATRAILAEERFKTSVDQSFVRDLDGSTTSRRWVGPIAVLSGTQELPQLRCDFAETFGLDQEAQTAIEAFHDAASLTAVEVQLKSGDLLLIDNMAAFHGRARFTASHGGEDRWLLRSFITGDLKKSLNERPGDGRIVEPPIPDGQPGEISSGATAGA